MQSGDLLVYWQFHMTPRVSTLLAETSQVYQLLFCRRYRVFAIRRCLGLVADASEGGRDVSRGLLVHSIPLR